MRTILETLTIAAEQFEKAGVDSPRLTAELLLAEVLGCKRIDLYLRFDQPLESNERTAFGEMYKRRIAREPLQYITGTAAFCGLDFEVNPAVLIPRPETEELAEEVAQVCEKVSSSQSLHILDIGTGSGCIAVTLAKRFPFAAVTAIDVSDDAISVARRNAQRHGVQNVAFEIADIFNDDALQGTFDVIVSNPPYVSREEIEAAQAEVRDFEPRLATTDNADGLTFYRRIVAVAPAHLNANGVLAFEVGIGQARHVQEMLEAAGFSVTIKKDLANIERIVIASRSAQ
ncbi:MAG TPA: peptide chain release factor N(5)-glutamine methyltransferase [Candidatus Kapabacteria bacterium]|nr:peptide chain release factor N(5)-glutamine methyltransferase [Candidatus Kapabacteria bacterium]